MILPDTTCPECGSTIELNVTFKTKPATVGWKVYCTGVRREPKSRILLGVAWLPDLKQGDIKPTAEWLKGLTYAVRESIAGIKLMGRVHEDRFELKLEAEAMDLFSHAREV